ncbi:hypothetical protein KJ611_00815 [Patescibacteria group bacterium]|nr:hypothetical protein [Patescibacteria group bacterium]MBU1705747.1 hypothetical protein [Patescibacteria group bacterium]
MKTLLIAAQDIKSITLAWIENGVLRYQKDVSVEPDNYLLALQDFLKETGLDLSEIESMAVVVGPGSFTASRVSVTLANALAWALGRPIVGLENEARLSVPELIKQVDFAALDFQAPPVLPVYNREPNITLKREA